MSFISGDNQFPSVTGAGKQSVYIGGVPDRRGALPNRSYAAGKTFRHTGTITL